MWTVLDCTGVTREWGGGGGGGEEEGGGSSTMAVMKP